MIQAAAPETVGTANQTFEDLLIIGGKSRAAIGFANACATNRNVSIVTKRRKPRLASDTQRVELADIAEHTLECVVVFLNRKATRDDALLTELRRIKPQRVCFVTGCGVLFGDKQASSREQSLLGAIDGAKSTIVRIANLSGVPRNGLVRASSSVLPITIRSAFVEPAELLKCVDEVFAADEQPEQLTLLGENRAWREELRKSEPNVIDKVGSVPGSVLRFMGGGYLVRSSVAGLKRFSPRARAFNFDTIMPTSEDQLLSLCNRHNAPHIAVCGYNNGVSHFGWRFPGKTVVPTCRSGNEIRIEDDTVTVDAGVTLKRCIEELKAKGKEFYVVPNFSYIGMGTVFFVPVHGSGSEVSTLGDTIEWVRFYDPWTNKIVETSRGEELFDESMYRLDTGYVLLQLKLRVRDCASYFVRQSELENPTASEVWAVFDDPETSNIEIRKNKADSDTIQVSKYYASDEATTPTDPTDDDRMEVPRDSIGKVWDRIEENKVSAWLFHWFVRTMAFHVELFMTEHEFEVFWNNHRDLPVSKIQLRFAKRDGMKHSPFGSEDRVSADLFMTKKNREKFLSFIREHLPNVRFNPGKQSM